MGLALPEHMVVVVSVPETACFRRSNCAPEHHTTVDVVAWPLQQGLIAHGLPMHRIAHQVCGLGRAEHQYRQGKKGSPPENGLTHRRSMVQT